ncbi:phosphatidylglycerol lysyltransferase domain-containing protein [Pedobacter sp. PWIIR3]
MQQLKFIVPFIRENAKIISSYLFTLFFVALGIWFIKHEGSELKQVKPLLLTANWVWLILGLGVSVAYVFVHGLMYRASFAAVSAKVSVWDGTILYLKRNFVSVFLPAGGVSSLAFFSAAIEKKGVGKSQINFASSIYGFVGILSVVVIAIPVFIYGIIEGTIGYGEWFGLITVLFLIAGLYLMFRSVFKKGKIYKLLIRYIPAAEVYAAEFASNKIERKHFLATLYYSLLIEVIGIVHIYIAMLALNIEPSLVFALISYIVAVVFLIISPFLRGLGAVEASMTFILIRLGYSSPEAVSLTLVYRFMEFWAPMALGALSFLLKINKLLMRVIPALLLLALGLINIISVLTPAIRERLLFLEDFLPLEAITASNYFVLVAGLFLLVTAAFMLKGLKMAWYFSVVLCLVSLVGHLGKAIDYEEGLFSILVLFILFASKKEYYIRHNKKLRTLGIQTTLLGMAGIFIYGCIGFYFLDKRHFNIDFNWLQSIRFTLQNFFLVGSSELQPADTFARDFLYSINVSGFLSLAFLVYTLVRPYISKPEINADEFDEALALLSKYGDSSVDYFKTYADKLIYKAEGIEGFIAYRIAGNFAVALEGPVASPEQKIELVKAFDKYCYESGVKSIYYRVSEESLKSFSALGKKRLFLGQEGTVDLTSFSLEGGSRKSIRNALKKVSDQGFVTKIYEAPILDGLLQKLKSVSDEWLSDTGREEIIFSQGMFDHLELKQQTIITIENAEEKIVAFLNVIPDFVKGEGTYDLIRKTADAPNGSIDFIMVALFNYLKARGYLAVNLGFAPLSGLASPENFPERSMKFAYEKISSFSHYKGLRAAKEKFSPAWSNKYLIYDHHYDLLQVPAVLSKVIKP